MFYGVIQEYQIIPSVSSHPPLTSVEVDFRVQLRRSSYFPSFMQLLFFNLLFIYLNSPKGIFFKLLLERKGEINIDAREEHQLVASCMRPNQGLNYDPLIMGQSLTN